MTTQAFGKKGIVNAPTPSNSKSLWRNSDRETSTIDEISSVRYEDQKVGFLLGAGIFFFPYIFAWALLRNGHSNLARAVGFSWFAFVMASFFITPLINDGPVSSQATVAGPTTLTQVSAQPWLYSTGEDAMRGTTAYYAVATASNLLQFDFPYSGGSTAQFAMMRRGDELRAGLIISKGQFTCFGGMDGDVVSLKFDSGSVLNFQCYRSPDGGATAIGIGGADDIIWRLRKAKKLVVEAQFYQAGYQQMTFNIEGFKW